MRIRSMKTYLTLIVLFLFLVVGCAHSPSHTSAVLPQSKSSPQPILLASNAGEIPVKSSSKPGDTIDDEYKDDQNLDYANDTFKEEKVEIADPLEPFNRAMHQFNDKLYFWALKPVAQGYKTVVPEPARIDVKNFFSNLGFPSRFLSCLLQADFSGAATEFGRFTINTIWGIGGLLDPSSNKELNLQKQDTDLGQPWESMVWGRVSISSGRYSGLPARVIRSILSVIISWIPSLTFIPGMQGKESRDMRKLMLHP